MECESKNILNIKWTQKIPDDGIVRIENRCSTLNNIYLNDYKYVKLIRAPDMKPYFGRDIASIIDLYSNETILNWRSKAFMDGKELVYNTTGILGGSCILNDNLILKVKLNEIEIGNTEIEFSGIDHVYSVEPQFENVSEFTVDITENNQDLVFKPFVEFKWLFFIIENVQTEWLTFDHIRFKFESPLYDTATVQFIATAYDLRHAIPVKYFDKVPTNSFYTFTNDFQTLNIQSLKIHFSRPFEILKLRIFFVD